VPTKAELEYEYTLYTNSLAAAKLAEQQGFPKKAVDHALDAWTHIDGMMQYARRYLDAQFDSIQAIDIVLRYAPLMFDFRALERLGGLLKDKRRIEKNTEVSLGDRLAEAEDRMWDNHRLWHHLEWHPGQLQSELRQILGGNQDNWRAAAELWEKLGLVVRQVEANSYRLTLATRLGAVIEAKCYSCGHRVEAPKAMLLEDATCPSCNLKSAFLFTS